MKPRVFIGSSKEGLGAAYALQNNLWRDIEPTVWTQDVFRPSQYILESLLDQLQRADAGIFVFSADDLIKMREKEYSVTRDNVIFELGLYIGQLGRSRSFIVASDKGNLHLPTDLLGLNYETYDSDRSDGNLDAALSPACTKLRPILKQIVPSSTLIPSELKQSLSERRDALSPLQREILHVFELFRTVSLEQLQTIFKDIPYKEMIYRLNHLQLLMFITFKPFEPTKNSEDQEFSITPAFENLISDFSQYSIDTLRHLNYYHSESLKNYRNLLSQNPRLNKNT